MYTVRFQFSANRAPDFLLGSQTIAEMEFAEISEIVALVQEFAESLDGYSGSDIKLVCKEAAMKPLRRIMDQIDVLDTNDTKMRWDKQVDPKTVPALP